MIIEIRKAGFINKGAELMLLAAHEKLKNRYPDATFLMAPSDIDGPMPYQKIVKMGFSLKAWLWKYGTQWGDFAVIIPKRLRDRYGIVLDKEIDVVIDAAGFAYGDQWGIGNAKVLARSSKRWKKNGTKVVLLPQAYGPFKKPGISKYVRRIVNNVDLIISREEESYRHLIEVTGKLDKIKIYPDFTNLISGILPESFDREKNKVALIPNYRMIDKTDELTQNAYVPFFINCAKLLKENQAKPFLLIHEGEKDIMLAKQISNSVGGIPIVKEDDALKIKGIIGSCDATIGSRFHGLVSALSQGVPSLGTGWSHKYRRLFEDYEFPEGLVNITEGKEALKNKLDFILNHEKRKRLIKRLKNRSEVFKKKSIEMWDKVFEVIEGDN